MFTEKFDYFYVEPSSYCSLACSRCPRTYDKSNYKLSHLSIDTFTEVISSDVFNDLRIIEFGGNYGDPIFHPQLDSLVKIAKEKRPKAQLIIHTSGNRSPQWWESFVKTLSESDRVLLSIDGLKDTNHLYREKSNWDWIESAIDQCSGKVHLTWKFIVFKYNQDQINDAIMFAKEKGVNTFLLTMSGVFNGDWEVDGVDPLAPSKKWIAPKVKRGDELIPKCQSSSRHYLSADGIYSPCCWMDFSKDFSFDMNSVVENKRLVRDVLESSKLQSLKDSWQARPVAMCRNKCSGDSNLELRSSHSQLVLNLDASIKELLTKVSEF